MIELVKHGMKDPSLFHIVVIFWIFFPVTFEISQVSYVWPIDYVTMVLQILDNGEQIGLKHFKPIKPLGSGDTGRFFLVSLFKQLNISNVLEALNSLHKD